MKDALTKINLAKLKMCEEWYGFLMRYGIEPVNVIVLSGWMSDWGEDF